MTHEQIASMVEVTSRAVHLRKREAERRSAQKALDQAYRDWKAKNDIGEIQRDTLEWTRMMVATKPQYQVLERAKSRERHAKSSLFKVIDRYQARAA